MALICNQVSKEYISQGENVVALQDVSFRVDDHEFVCIVGPSGCGKTTLLKVIAGLMSPTTGEIQFGADSLNGHSRSSMVFQEQSLFPWLSVIDNMALGLEMQGLKNKERHQQAREMISKVGLDGFANAHPHQLSGGMKQRVALARALLTDPEILLMDEPFGALDAQTRLVLQEELLRIWREERKTVVFVTHDIEEAVLLSDRVLVMTGRPGTIQEELRIPLDRPRDLTDRDHPKISEIKWHIWKILEDEVRKDLNLVV